MYWNPLIQTQYMDRHAGEENLVELNDVIFALHATVINLVYVSQVIIFRVYIHMPIYPNLIWS